MKFEHLAKPFKPFRPALLNTAKFLALCGGLIFFLTLFYHINSPPLPSKKEPILVYSNQNGDDLKRIFLKTINQTKHSLLLQIYGLTDPDIILGLQQFNRKEGSLNLFYDPSGSPGLKDKLPFATPIKRQGLMHKKILISDKKRVFIGTANFTPTSLCMHDNVVIGFHDEKFAQFLEESLENKYQFTLNTQKIELWHLPDFQGECLKNLLTLIQQAKKKIRIALFTFTHPMIIESLICAKKRGVLIEIALDFYSAKGSSQNAVERLVTAGITPRISQGGSKLLHHKWCIIDKKILLLGSANWTKSAFAKNDDCLLVLKNLKPEQRKVFKKIWENIKYNSTLAD